MIGSLRRATLADPSLVSPNDLVAVTPTQVYVTNDHRHAAGPMRAVEEYLRQPWTNAALSTLHSSNRRSRVTSRRTRLVTWTGKRAASTGRLS